MTPARDAAYGHQPVFALFPPQVEAQAREALSVVLMRMDGLSGTREEHLEAVRVAVNAMADSILDGPGTVFDPADPVPLRDNRYAHPVRVAELAMVLTRLAGGQRAHMRAAGIASMLMNVGYVRMRSPDLEIPAPFDEEQRAQLRPHPQLSVDLLTGSGLAEDVLTAIVQHHERWDGSGYPGAMRGSAISPLARIIAVADSYVALASQRPQRPARSRAQVEAHFGDASGMLYDPRVVKVLLEALPDAVLFERPVAA